jgi:crotonobetainyl-CoA:carnitine CoA-transferase CaiB-like acyl-CoA transferase
MTLPLVGYRIVSLAEQFPGPFATMLLADLGADVILVERPAGGDPSRRYDGHFAALNRNKRSIVLDLKSPEGMAAFYRLLDTSHALIEGFRPGVMERLGLGAQSLREARPDLVYVSISSFGQSGPRMAVAGHDLSIQGTAGMLDLSERGNAAVPTLPLADIASATFAALGLVIGLLERERRGEASMIDVSMFDSLVSWMAPWLVPAMNNMRQAPFPPLEPGYGVFSSADGRSFTLSIAGEDHMWAELCDLLDLDDLRRLREHERETERKAITSRLQGAFAHRTWDWIEPNLAVRKIAFGAVLGLNEVADDAQVRARGLVFSVPSDPKSIRYIRQPILFDGDGGAISRGCPDLGEHTAEILNELGFATRQIAELIETQAAGR